MIADMSDLRILNYGIRSPRSRLPIVVVAVALAMSIAIQVILRARDLIEEPIEREPRIDTNLHESARIR
jgi:hypothetical protein